MFLKVNITKTLTLGWICLFSLSAFSQSSVSLKNEQRRIQKEINKIKATLNKTKEDQKVSLGHLRLIQRKVNLRQSLLNTINAEIRIIRKKINNLMGKINTAEKDLTKLKYIYQKSVVNYYKSQGNAAWWKYFFNNTSISSSIRMFTYFNAYERSLRQQNQKIKDLQASIKSQVKVLEQERKKQTQVAQTKKKELSSLKKEKSSQKQLVGSLQKKSKNLQSQINKKVQKQRALEKQIALAIKKEIAKSKKRNDTKRSFPTDKKVTDFDKSFLARKNKMPWPVDGIILNSFGSNIVENSAVSGKNLGTTFRSKVHSQVVTIANGIVSSSILFQGIYTVIIKHGSYFSGYSNLASIAVNKGDVVFANTPIGTVAKSEDGDWGELVLQIANLKGNVNPEIWLRD